MVYKCNWLAECEIPTKLVEEGADLTATCMIKPEVNYTADDLTVRLMDREVNHSLFHVMDSARKHVQINFTNIRIEKGKDFQILNYYLPKIPGKMTKHIQIRVASMYLSVLPYRIYGCTFF